jgi:hypothetical protein
MRAEFRIRIWATWDGNWQSHSKETLPCPTADQYAGPDGMDDLLDGIQHDEVCAEGCELIVHEVSLYLGIPVRIVNERIQFDILYDVESEEAKSIRELQTIAVDGFMFWSECWIDDIKVEVIEVAHLSK